MAKRKVVGGEINLQFQPKQDKLWKMVSRGKATWIGYGGSRGAAKSAAIRLVLMRLAFAQDDDKTRFLFPQGRALIFRRKFTDLWENHISKFFSDWPQTRAYYNTQTKEMTFPSGFVVKFGYAEHEGDIKDFQGKEYRWIFVDEATHLTQAEIEFLKTTNRAPNCDEHQCKMVLTMNPGGVGHKFIKRIFYDKQYVGNENPDSYAFIQAYGWDNVEWVRPALKELFGPEKKPFENIFRYYALDDQQRFNLFVTRSDYGRILDALPESMRVGHLLGRWDIFAGQYFDCFNPAVHCYRPEQRRLEPWHSRWLGIDWGFAHPAACYWNAQDGPMTRTYRELLVRGVGPRELASMIVNKCGNDEKPDAIYLSPDAFAKRTDADTIAQQMSAVFAEVGWPDCSPADNDRVGGWALMYDMLKHGKWEISETCANLIGTLPAMARDDKKQEDCIKFNASEGKLDGDDAADAARYALKSRISSREQPLETKISEAISQQRSQGILTDPTSEMIRRAQLAEKLRQSSGPIHFAYRHGHGSRRSSRRPVPFS
jgi:phage terminase large subunit